MTLNEWGAHGMDVVAMLALFFLPGYALARIVEIRGLLAWAIAPAVTATVSAVGSTVMGLIGVRWSLLTFAAALLGIALVLGLVRLSLPGGETLRTIQMSWLSRVLMLGAIGVLVLPLLCAIAPQDVILQIDPTFHMNAVALIQDTGNASSFGGLTRMFGMDTTQTTVPANWHALVVLVAPLTGTVVATNIMAIVVPVVWVVSMSALATVVSPSRGCRAEATIALIPAIVVIPTFITTRYPILPNALQVAMMPALLAVMLAAATVPVMTRARTIYFLLAVGSSLGVALIHPSVLFSGLVLTVLPGIYFLWRRGRFLWRVNCRRLGVEAIGLGAVIAALVLVVLLIPGVVHKLVAMSVDYYTNRGPLLASIPKTLTVWPLITAEAGSAATVPLTLTQGGILILTVAGFARLVRTPRGRYLVLMWLGAAALTFTVLSRQGPLVGFAGLWYMSPHRTMAIQAIPQLLVIGAGLAWIMRLIGNSLGKQRESIIALCLSALIVTGSLTHNVRSYLYRSVYHPQSGELADIASPGEIAMIRSLENTLPRDAVVLGDPFNGSALVKAVANRSVVFPQLFFRASNFDENILRYQFRLLDSSPLVCSIVEKRGITHVYLDTDATSFGKDNTLEAPGLYGVDTSRGFTKVAEGGSASVWRIDACSE